LREVPDRQVERRPRHEKEAAHRVGQVRLQHQPRHPSAHYAGLLAEIAGEPLGVAAGDVAAADDDIEVLRANAAKHFREDRVVVLQVAIHDRKIRRRRRQHAFNARR
jgi:hypothetical protein